MFEILFLVVIAYGIYWFFSRPKSTAVEATTAADGSHVVKKTVGNPFLQDGLEYPRFFTVSLVMILVAFNIFAYDVMVGIGVAILQAIVAFALFLSLPLEKKNPLSVFMTFLAIASALAIGYRANGFVQSVNSVVYTGSMLVLLLMLVVDRVQWTGMWFLRYVVKGFFSSFGHIFKLFNYTSKNKNANLSLGGILKTTIITVIVLVFFVSLLTQADPIFAQLVEKVWEQAIGRVIATVLLAVVVIILMTLRLRTLREDNSQPLSFLNFQDVFVPGVAVSIAFGVFLVIQAKYLFGTGADLQSFGLTLSQYVRKGFIELLTAAFFGGLLSYCISLIGRHYESDSRSTRLQVLNVALVSELLMLLVSAWQRNSMYMEAYGLTRVRMVGVLFLMWLAGFLCLLMLFSLWKKWTEAKLFLGVLLLSTCVFVGLNVQNIDHAIVEATPSHHDFRDYFYLIALSEDGRAGWPLAVSAAEELVPTFAQKTTFTDIDKAQLANLKLSLIALTEKRQNLERQYMPYEQLRAKNNAEAAQATTFGTYYEVYEEKVPEWLEPQRKWQSWQYSEHEGYKQLTSNPDFYTAKVASLLEQIKQIQVTKNLDLYQQENRLLHELKYPFLTVNLRYYPQSVDMLRNPIDRTMKPASTAMPAATPISSMFPITSPTPGGNCDHVNGLFEYPVANATKCLYTETGTDFYECDPGFKNYNFTCTAIEKIPEPTPVASQSPWMGYPASPSPALDTPY